MHNCTTDINSVIILKIKSKTSYIYEFNEGKTHKKNLVENHLCAHATKRQKKDNHCTVVKCQHLRNRNTFEHEDVYHLLTLWG